MHIELGKFVAISGKSQVSLYRYKKRMFQKKAVFESFVLSQDCWLCFTF